MQGKNEQQIGVSYVNIDSIKPYEKNARSHGQEDVKSIVASIREFGFNDPIGVWNDIIVEGHGRWMAAKELGMETVPVLRLDHLTDEQRKAYGLAHNKTAELSSWNFNVLDAELKDIADIDMSQFGFDMAAVDPQEPQGQQEIQEVDFDMEPPEEPDAKPGDIYILGGVQADLWRLHRSERDRQSHGRSEGGHGFHRSALWDEKAERRRRKRQSEL